MGCGGSKDATHVESSSGDSGLKIAPEKIKKERVTEVGFGSSEALKTFDASDFEKTSEFDYLFKILLLGSQGVGKSSLLARFADNEFVDNYKTTVGVDFKIRTIEIDNKTIKLQLWDTAGQERFKTVTNTYFRGAHGVIIVYDITDTHTFEQIEDCWLNEVEKNAPENVVLMMVGNKCDMSNRTVSVKRAKDFAKTKDALFLETSAKDATNVNKAFMMLADAIKERIK
eukprot:TRINITY_DN328_c0_g3_i3.p1 TRINITY_DN328_c0_g3~~TRINITY_DN328_c0_g3_i3.p1  ORF type:complete len:228 (-),score=53.27 TRINITY_DN328_c0_g3_i3:93-776(-)